jgi:hypothetical protein
VLNIVVGGVILETGEANKQLYLPMTPNPQVSFFSFGGRADSLATSVLELVKMSSVLIMLP